MVILASSASPLVLFILSFKSKNAGVPIRSDAYNLFGNEVATNICEEQSSSRWQRRTAKRRQRTEELLHSVEIGGLPILPLLSVPSAPSNSLFSAGITPILNIPPASIITWDTICTLALIGLQPSCYHPQAVIVTMDMHFWPRWPMSDLDHRHPHSNVSSSVEPNV